MSEKLKKLTGKNPRDFEPAASDLLNIPDTKLFEELVQSEDFLFDFVKQNVGNRINKACNSSNYKNLLEFLKYYSPSYEEVIISNLVKHADEDLTDIMLEKFENGTEDEKTYCAKYFAYIQDPLSLEYLKSNAYSENTYLSANCARTLALFGDGESYNQALEKLDSDDEFEILDGVKFLVSYGDKKACPKIIETIKKSSMGENLAGELTYLYDLLSVLKDNKTDGLYIFNLIISGLGEILPVSQVFDFQIYEVIQTLKEEALSSQSAVALLNAKEKFNTLTENNEYLYDESKDVKQEISDIKDLLETINSKDLENLADNELDENSLFVYTAIDFTFDDKKVRELLNSKNQTLILKAIETLKRINCLTENDKNTALKNVDNQDIKNIISAILL